MAQLEPPAQAYSRIIVQPPVETQRLRVKVQQLPVAPQPGLSPPRAQELTPVYH
jgi:hypothetical protein